MKKKKLQKLSLEKFRISRLNSNSRIIGGYTVNTLADSRQTCKQGTCTLSTDNTKTESEVISELCPPPTFVCQR